MFPHYCSRLEALARKPEVQNLLVSWVTENWTGARIPREKVRSGDGVGPGVRWLGVQFDGSILEMNDEAHVRLLGVSAVDELNDQVSENTEAIYFADRSRAGVLVQLADRPAFSSPVFNPFPVSDKVSVICQW